MGRKSHPAVMPSMKFKDVLSQSAPRDSGTNSRKCDDSSNLRVDHSDSATNRCRGKTACAELERHRSTNNSKPELAINRQNKEHQLT